MKQHQGLEFDFLVDWSKYAENLEKLKAIRTTEMLEAADEGLQFPPEDEIALRHSLITPEQALSFINKNMRIGNLDSFEKLIISKAAMLITFFQAMQSSYVLKDDLNLKELITEIKNDISLILNISVSKKGWLVDNILNPRKRFSLFGDRVEKKGLFSKGEERQ